MLGTNARIRCHGLWLAATHWSHSELGEHILDWKQFLMMFMPRALRLNAPDHFFPMTQSSFAYVFLSSA